MGNIVYEKQRRMDEKKKRSSQCQIDLKNEDSELVLGDEFS